MVIYNKKETVGNVTNIVLSRHEALNIIQELSAKLLNKEVPSMCRDYLTIGDVKFDIVSEDELSDLAHNLQKKGSVSDET